MAATRCSWLACVWLQGLCRACRVPQRPETRVGLEVYRSGTKCIELTLAQVCAEVAPIGNTSGTGRRGTDFWIKGRPTTLGKADEGPNSASRAHIYGCRRQVRVAHGDCAFPQFGSSKIRRRVGPPALLQCSDLGAQSAAAAGLQDGRQSSTPLRSMATKAASVANWLIIIAVGVLPMPAAVVDGRIALVHHVSGLGVQPVN